MEFPKALENSFDLPIDFTNDGPILLFLKGIPPSSIDAEMRSLCFLNVEYDMDGILFLKAMLIMFDSNISTGRNFELLQSYLHRFLLIHSDAIVLNNSLWSILIQTMRNHDLTANRFRYMLQKNLCLCKVFAKLPTI